MPNAPAIDNDQVKVLVVNRQPHKKTRLHEHKVNRVMIYLQPGKQNFEYPETKKKSVLTWKAGEAKWSPAGGKISPRSSATSRSLSWKWS